MAISSISPYNQYGYSNQYLCKESTIRDWLQIAEENPGGMVAEDVPEDHREQESEESTKSMWALVG